jgi:hypothetical protein
MPCHKVPAPQADGVAARLCPPPEAGGAWRLLVGVGISDLIFQNVKSVISGVLWADGREIIREPRTMPCLKVPAPQANRVAARLCPPQAAWREGTRAGGTWPDRRCGGG